MAELSRAIPGDLHFIRQCFGKHAASVFAAMVVNNTAYCGLKWNLHEAASAERLEYQSTGSFCGKI